MTLIDHWNRFWFARADNRPLCLLRITFGSTLVLHSVLWGGIHDFDSIRFLFPRPTFDSPDKYFLDGFRMPVPGFDWLPVPAYEAFYWIDVAVLVLGVLFVLGIATRVVGAILALGLLYLFLLSQFFYHHHVMCLVVVMLVLGLSPCGAHYSVDAVVRRWWSARFTAAAPPPRDYLVLPIRLIQVFVSILYLFTFLAKLNDGWWTGRIMQVFCDTGSLNRERADWVFATVGVAWLARITVVSEGFLAIGLWLPRVRWLAIAVGIGLHLGITALMPVRTFSYQMISLYVLFAWPAPAACGLTPDSKN